MGKLSTIGLIWLLVFALTLVIIDEQLSRTNPEQTSNKAKKPKPEDIEVSEPSGFVALHVDGNLTERSWRRGIKDLPVLNTSITYVIENTGNVSAKPLEVEITLGSTYYSTETVQDLRPNSEFTDSTTFSVDYDQNKKLKIEARGGNTSAAWSYTINAELPRQPVGHLSKLFVTPNEWYVQSTYKEITRNVFFVHWFAIRDWVGKNIEYVGDQESHGSIDFWQVGRETLESRMGDSEDFAVLLCSLLRADGWDAEDVYVVIGQNQAGDHHAWVKLNIPMIGWYNIEPQLDGWNTLIGDFAALHGFTAIYNFNDQIFVEL